ncbi:MAG TPA: PLP-dependent transferase, partial [Ferruginibacter sp.]|nr:PLP-dependent transferase [Ferruginibacter sp.]
IFDQWSVQYSEADMAGTDIESSIRDNTKLIWIETPSNPLLKITDIRNIVTKAKTRNIIVGCDNTFAPMLQRPLEMGADFVMHSSTKFLCGHSDVLGGAVILNNDNPYTQKIRDYQVTAGSVPSPFDCWLLSRSLSTFPLRMNASCDNAMALAAYLVQHPSIEKVLYPGLTNHHNYQVGLQQMKKPGGVLSVLVKGNKKQALAFASRLKLIKHATSLGGVETLIEHRRSAEGEHPRSPENLLRISAGIEHIDDLIADLEQGLKDSLPLTGVI